MIQAVEQESAFSGVLYSRYCDGARPVQVVDGGWSVAKEGTPTMFTTAQGLLAELTGHPKGRGWSVDRYFGRGKWAPKKPIGRADVFELFPLAEPSRGVVLLEPLAPLLLAFRTNVPDPAISVARRRRGKGKRRARKNLQSSLVVSGPVGIDLVNRSHEVRKLLFAGFGRRIFSAGYDAEDVLQEVFKGLLARNKGKCPWDPGKSSFGHYVYMVCGCVLSNYHRKMKRRRQFEQSGLMSYVDGQREYRDAASNVTRPARESAEQAASLFGEAADDLVDYMLSHPRGSSTDACLAIDVLPYVVGAMPRVKIAEALQVSMAAISRAVSFLRRSAVAWRASLAVV